MILLLACTGASPDDGPKDTGDPLTWLAPDDVSVEQAIGFHDDSRQDMLFDDETIPRFGLEISQSNMNQLRQEGKYDEHEWVEAAFVFEGVRYDPVGVRIKGENSYLPIDDKPSLKVDFNKYVDGMEFMGLRELTLNNMYNDYSMMHERVAYRLMREAGIPSSRSGHVLLTLNGEDYGLYAGVENVDKTMARRWFDEVGEGIMFEVWDVDFYDGYIDSFQLEFGEDDRTSLQGVADGLETAGYAGFVAASDYMDMEQFVRFYAAETVVGQYDSYPFANPGDDAHVYLDSISGLLVWLPHGIDESFYYPDRDPRTVNGIVAKRCLQLEACTQDYYDTVWEIQALAESIDLLGYAIEVRAQIDELVRNDPHRPYDMSSVTYYQDLMIEFIETRAEKLPQWVGPRPE